VPWTVQSRAANGGTDQITASWPTCEHYTREGAVYSNETTPGPSPPKFTPYPTLQAWADRDHPNSVTIDVYRFPGPDCGPASPHQLTLHAATRTGTLPTTLVHGPLGAETSTG
jgi:hypothetical protein